VFTKGSRYLNAGTYSVPGPTGATVTVTRLPLPTVRPVRGWHPVTDGQRLDLIAYQYLKDPTAFWMLCDANGTPAPSALAAHPLVAIPATPN
jgi:hypothetical protein